MTEVRRIAYISGPVDAARVYDDWRSATPPDYYGTLYLLELYRIVERLGAACLVVTTLPGARPTVRRDRLTIVNHPLPDDASGVRYHIAMLAWALRCVLTVARFRASFAILTAGQDYFWPFALLRLVGTRLVVSLHCTLWPKLQSRKPHRRILHWLNGRLLFPVCDHIQANSQAGIAQVREVSAGLQRPPVRYLATYDPAQFADARMLSWPEAGDRFELLFVGRIAANKGVFDAIRMMAILEHRHPGRYGLAICGSGPDAGKLPAAIREAGIDKVVTVHGECPAEQLHALYARSHAVLVPTRSDFEEGQPKVAFEAVLNFRPLIMSAACPALEDVREATVEARVDDIDDYVRAIEALSGDRDRYNLKVAGAASVRGAFLEPGNGYAAALSNAFYRLAEPGA